MGEVGIKMKIAKRLIECHFLHFLPVANSQRKSSQGAPSERLGSKSLEESGEFEKFVQMNCIYQLKR